MKKVLLLLVALAAFAAFPAMAFAGDNGGNEQENEVEVGEQENESGQDTNADNGGQAGNQTGTCQQVAGGDADCSIDQSQNFERNVFIDNNGNGVDDDEEGVGGGHVTRGVGGGGVGGVTLARTGFDAWVLALIGGLSLAGGLGLLAAQRRGRIDA
jgi:hypothetical protein